MYDGEILESYISLGDFFPTTTTTTTSSSSCIVQQHMCGVQMPSGEGSMSTLLRVPWWWMVTHWGSTLHTAGSAH